MGQKVVAAYKPRIFDGLCHGHCEGQCEISGLSFNALTFCCRTVDSLSG